MEKAIETIGSLNELKAYCCPRVSHIKEWYLKCIDCQQQRKCTVGKRAIELMNRDTRPAPTDKFAAARAKAVEMQVQKAREACRTALKSEDPIQWIMEHYKADRHIASNYLHRWKRTYPDLFVNPIDEKLAQHNQNQIQEARKSAEEVFSKDNPLQYCIEKSGKSHSVAMKRIRSWMDRYPDLAEQYGMEEKYEKLKNKPGRPKKGEGPMPANQPVQPATDEVSVNDFLKETEDIAAENYVDPKIYQPQEKKDDSRYHRVYNNPEKPRDDYKGPILKMETSSPVIRKDPCVINARLEKNPQKAPEKPAIYESPDDILRKEIERKKDEIQREIEYMEQEIKLRREHLQVLGRTLYILTGKA